MRRLTKDALTRLEFHSISRNIPQVIATDKKMPFGEEDDELPLILFHGQILLDWGRYQRALLRGWCWVDEYDPRRHDRDPVTLALRASYLSDAQRAIAVVRLLRLMRTHPLDLLPYDAQLSRPLTSKKAAEHFANIEWNVRIHSLQRARVIEEQCEVPSFVRAVEEGRVTLAKGAEAVHLLSREPATLERIAKMVDRLAINRAIDLAIFKLDHPLPRRHRQQRERQIVQQQRHDWIFTKEDRVQAQRRTIELFKRVNIVVGRNDEGGTSLAKALDRLHRGGRDLSVGDFPEPTFAMTWKSLDEKKD